MSFLKGFILSRRSPCPNLVKGYTLEALLRRCPSDLRKQIDARWEMTGGDTTRTTKGALVNIQSILAEKATKPGCARLFVEPTQTNSREVTLAERRNMPSEFKAFMAKYNNERSSEFRFVYTSPRVGIWEFKSNKKGVSLDGRDLRVDGPLGIQWTAKVRHPFNNRLADKRLQGTVEGMTYLREGGRSIVIFKVITNNAHMYIYLCPFSAFMYLIGPPTRTAITSCWTSHSCC
jgi:hypothetical protein